MAANRARVRFRLEGLLWGLVLGSIFVGVGAVARERVLNEERKRHTLRFRQVLIFVQNYSTTFRRLPNAALANECGNPALSWRVPLARYSLHECFYPPAPSFAPKNSSGVPREAGYFAWNTDNIEGRVSMATNVFAITGPGTAFDGEKRRRLQDLYGDTILIVEVANSGTHWMQPGDFDVRTMPRTIGAADGKGISGCRGDGFCVGFADGEVWFLGNDTPFDALSKFFTIDGAKKHDRDEILGEYALGSTAWP